MRVKDWNPQVIADLVNDAMPERIEEAATHLATRIKWNTKVGTVTRPMYTRGPYAGQWWTARDGGVLRRSVRVVKNHNERPVLTAGGLLFKIGDYRVYVGHKKAYYAPIVEYFTPFVRPMLEVQLPVIKRILGAR